jgi:hypothetical protein
MVERVMMTVAPSLAFVGNLVQPTPLIAGLCVLRITHPDLFVKAKLGTLKLDEVREALNLGSPEPEADQWSRYVALGFWRYGLGEEIPDDELRQFRSAIGGGLFHSRDQIVPFVANGIVDRLMPAR